MSPGRSKAADYTLKIGVFKRSLNQWYERGNLRPERCFCAPDRLDCWLRKQKGETMIHDHPSRRTFVLGALGAASAAVTAGALFPRYGALAQGAGPRRIDVHHHLTPPAYVQELAPNNLLLPPTLNWSAQKDVEAMDQGSTSVSITSITTPGLWFGTHAPARRLARACNDYAAKLMSDFPRRYGMYVNVPLPDIDGTLKEIEYGMDVLKADGVSVFTSYGDKWLGDPYFEPIYAELHRRKAVLYTHPTSNACCVNLLKSDAFNDSLIEYGTDTTRAITKMMTSGMARKYPDMKVIWSHGGGTMPFLLTRFMATGRAAQNRENFPDGFLPEARRFFYDTANVFNRASLLALKEVIPVSNILFGTDVPFGTPKGTADGIIGANVFDEAELALIDRGNAEKLFPHYKA
jgi:predicted TIM-barrel fold metal-dependent hydrolase